MKMICRSGPAALAAALLFLASAVSTDSPEDLPPLSPSSPSPPSSPSSRAEWCRRACEGVSVPPCPAVCPPPAVNLSCPKPRCPALPRAPPCPACAVTCPKPECPVPVCPPPVCSAPVCPQPVCSAGAHSAFTYPQPASVRAGVPQGDDMVTGVGAYRLYHEQLLDWAGARDACAEQGAHLAVPNSQAEVNIIVKKMAEKKISWAHIGFNDLVIEGQYTTVLGQPLERAGYDRWGPGQPNGGREQNCGFMWDDGRLADGACSTAGAFVCELSFVPR